MFSPEVPIRLIDYDVRLLTWLYQGRLEAPTVVPFSQYQAEAFLSASEIDHVTVLQATVHSATGTLFHIRRRLVWDRYSHLCLG